MLANGSPNDVWQAFQAQLRVAPESVGERDGGRCLAVMVLGAGCVESLQDEAVLSFFILAGYRMRTKVRMFHHSRQVFMLAVRNDQQGRDAAVP